MGLAHEKQRTDLERENGLIVQLSFDPAHKQVDVFWRTDFDGLLHLHAISPQVLIPEDKPSIGKGQEGRSEEQTWGQRSSEDTTVVCRTQ